MLRLWSLAAILLISICTFARTAHAQCGNAVCSGETILGCPSDCLISDDFESGFDGWQTGQSFAGFTNPANGGPQGTGDAFMRMVSTGASGVGSRLAMFNAAQWTGDFTAKGQTAVYVDARNLGNSPITLRVWLENQGADAVSGGITLAPNSAWQSLVFPIDAASLSGTNPSSVLTNVTRMYFVHNTGTNMPPSAYAASLGLDNITNVEPSTCGDDNQQGLETCDGNDLAGQTCTDFGYVNGSGLACASTCDAFDTSGCSAVCNNNVAEPSESCDGADLAGTDCTDLGYVNAGGLACNGSCGFDPSGCTAVCGNSVPEPGEECDEGGNTAGCDSDCTLPSCGDGICNLTFGDTSANCPADCASVCGDGTATQSESCDGQDLQGNDCTDFGYVEPTGLACRPTCDGFDSSSCMTACGNNTSEPGEACDGTDLGGLDCTDFSYVNAAGLACDATCGAVETTGCTAVCGNTVTEPGEACDSGGINMSTCDSDCTSPTCGDSTCNAAAGENAGTCLADCPTTCGDTFVTGSEMCDGTNLAGSDCSAFGFVDTAGLACNATCTDFDATGCMPSCGNGVSEPGESCDGAALGGNDCTSFGFVDAAGLACNGVCLGFDTSSCTAVCGNSVAEPDEECDEGGNTMTCDDDCTAPACPDGVCNDVAETPDSCPQDCAAVCGDGAATHNEPCDGMDLLGADCTSEGFSNPDGLACSATCDAIDASGCTSTCGDGMREPDEDCDDGNLDDGDGCSATCQPEDGMGGMGGMGGSGGDGGMGGMATVDEIPTQDDCGCRIVGTKSRKSHWLASLAVLGLALMRRRSDRDE